MAVRFWDPTWADSGYRFYAYRFDGVGWTPTGQTWLHTDKVGHAGAYNTTYYIKGSQPAGFCQVCGYSYNAVLGNQYWTCAPQQYMS